MSWTGEYDYMCPQEPRPPAKELLAKAKARIVEMENAIADACHAIALGRPGPEIVDGLTPYLPDEDEATETNEP